MAPKAAERAAVEGRIREGARRLCLSNDTVGRFLERATPRQMDAVAGLADHELSVREANRRNSLLRKAAFPAVKSIEDFDFADVKMPEGHGAEDMRPLQWVESAQDCLPHGQTGRGKTRLAIALGMLCVGAGKTACHFSCAQLALMLQKAQEDGRLDTAYADIGRADLVILDEFGYIPLDSQGAKPLFQVMSMSHETRSLIVTTNIEFPRWGAVLADDKLAAVVDRIVHHGRLIELGSNNRRVEESLMLGNTGKRQWRLP